MTRSIFALIGIIGMLASMGKAADGSEHKNTNLWTTIFIVSFVLAVLSAISPKRRKTR